MIEIKINNPDKLYHPSSNKLKLWIKNSLNSLKIKIAIVNIQILGFQEMQSYNFRYRAQNKATNILSFPFEILPGMPKNCKDIYFLGDLIICPEILYTEAKKQHKLLDNHWCHILIHGLLHLIGYNHIEESDANEMEKMEIYLLEKFGISNPYTPSLY